MAGTVDIVIPIEAEPAMALADSPTKPWAAS